MKNAEIQQAAIDAYLRVTHMSFGEKHERGIAAAVAAVAPLLLAESVVGGEEFLPFHDTCMRGLHGKALRDFLANRLASLTAKPDPAVEAVGALPELNGWSEQARKSAAERIVAAVDAARAK